ncbi:MAG: hypothetical protein WCF04_01765, partial [Candidatus Nanopelagicales bacterium]
NAAGRPPTDGPAHPDHRAAGLPRPRTDGPPMTPGMAWWWYLFGPDTQRARLACTTEHWQVSYAGRSTVTLASPRALIRALAAHGPCPCLLAPGNCSTPPD